MKKSAYKKITSLIMALMMCLSIGTCTVFAATTNSDSGLISDLLSKATTSSRAQTRKTGDIQPMTFDYVRKNINNMVQNMGHKYVLKGSTNVDLSRDIYITDPRIVNVRVDTSDVDWNTGGVYPIRYTVCFKPSNPDKYDTASLNIKDAKAYDKDARLSGTTISSEYGTSDAPGAHTNRSVCYVYTDCSSRLQNNQYTTLTFGALVHVAVPAYLDNLLGKAVPIYQSNTTMYSTSKAPEIPNRYYENLQGSFQYLSYKVTTQFRLKVGDSGCACNYCGKKYNETGAHAYYSYAKEGVESHHCEHSGSWSTYSAWSQEFVSGDTFRVEIFTVQ